MTQQELDRLWDPQGAPAAGGEAIDALEARLSSLRGPEALPVLDLPARVGKSRSRELPGGRNQRFEWLALAASLLLIAGALFGWFATRPGETASEQSVAFTPVPVESRAPKAWVVEDFEGEAMCDAPGIDTAVREAGEMPEGVDLDAGAGSTARLRQGTGMVQLHPHTQVRQVAGELELRRGRVWASLSKREDGEAWTLRSGSVTLRTQSARFVFWSRERLIDQVGVLAGAQDELGLELVSGELTIESAGQVLEVRAGQSCRAQLDERSLATIGGFVCGPTVDVAP